MMTVTDTMRRLKDKARPGQLDGMARFGISIKKRLGVPIPDLRALAKEIGKNHDLALKLWDTGISDARILAGMIDEPNKLTGKQMEDWVKDFDSWDVCDQVCMNLFEKTPLVREKIKQWSRRKEEYVKRAAFALIACLAWHDRTAGDGVFMAFFSLIKKAATDERNYVKKAVNWALRNIGKRNGDLNRAALKLAKEIIAIDSRPARWIASDAIRELSSMPVKKRLEKRSSCGHHDRQEQT
ncbi:MAG TPA: DNA alkylation repair protein [bacterium]